MRKRKDALTKKYLYPHGITPPLKNVRKRRFRKTLKKKYIDFPEIEKEVKRLFREVRDFLRCSQLDIFFGAPTSGNEDYSSIISRIMRRRV